MSDRPRRLKGSDVLLLLLLLGRVALFDSAL